jgi:hypothetical protein
VDERPSTVLKVEFDGKEAALEISAPDVWVICQSGDITDERVAVNRAPETARAPGLKMVPTPCGSYQDSASVTANRPSTVRSPIFQSKEGAIMSELPRLRT